MTIPLPPVLPRAVKLPTRASGLKGPCGGLRCRFRLAPIPVADLTTRGPYSALLRVGLAIPFLLPRPWWALTPPFHHHHGPTGRTRHHGSLFSVALSLGLPPPGVTRHPSFIESGLSSGFAPRGHPAIRARGGLRGPARGVNREACRQIESKARIHTVERPARHRSKPQAKACKQISLSCLWIAELA